MRKVICMVFGRACSDTTARLDRAFHEFSEANDRLQRVSLTVIDESVQPNLRHHSHDRVGEAVADVIRRHRKRHP